MICFMDRTFCSTDCVNTECYRNFSPELRERAKEWWGGMEGEPPVAFSDLKCKDYKAPWPNIDSGLEDMS